jgi:phage repressor protein C with HTH and peptisase S24 domain
MAGRVTKRNGTPKSSRRAARSAAFPDRNIADVHSSTQDAAAPRPSSERISRDMREANVMRRHERSLTHGWIWNAIDTLAARHGLTPSGLARSAGLDPTTFNRSKRLTSEGRPRWPSTESIAKVLEVTGTTLDAFATLQFETPLEISYENVERGEIAGIKIVAEVRGAVVPDWNPTPARALLASGDAMVAPMQRRFAIVVGDSSLEPVYSPGNILIVSEAAAPRVGDRVLVKMLDMPVVPRILLATSAADVTLVSYTDSSQNLCVRHGDVDWMARIILVKQ